MMSISVKSTMGFCSRRRVSRADGVSLAHELPGSFLTIQPGEPQLCRGLCGRRSLGRSGEFLVGSVEERARREQIRIFKI